MSNNPNQPEQPGEGEQPPQRTPPPGRGDKTTVIASGESYGVRVIETEESVIINYYAELEDALPDSAAVKQTLNQALRDTGRANTDKTLIYEAL